MRTSLRSAALAAAISLLCAGGAVAQNSTTQTPEQREAQMRKLREQTDGMYNQDLDPGKREFRDQMQILMDTVATLDAIGDRTRRAYGAGNLAVLSSQARQLRAACLATGRVVSAALPRFQVLGASSRLGNQVLTAYRSELTAMEKVAGDCDKTATGAMAQGNEGAKRIQQLAETVGRAVVKHDQAATDLLRALEIELRPRGYVRPTGR